MQQLLSLIGHHGYILVFVIVLAEALGLPVPAAVALVAGGAAAAAGVLGMYRLLLLAVLAMLLGDCLLFVAGRHMGWGLLGFLCKLSVNPEACILRSAESFYKRGKATLLFAKFIPGINTMAPPLAGSMKMPPDIFLRLDLAGATLYATVYLAVGFCSAIFCFRHARLSNRRSCGRGGDFSGADRVRPLPGLALS
jgi:membrane protein DedA with SNARE-associated domain